MPDIRKVILSDLSGRLMYPQTSVEQVLLDSGETLKHFLENLTYDGYPLLGVATSETTPSLEKGFYFADSGTYENFNIVVDASEFAIILCDSGVYTKEKLFTKGSITAQVIYNALGYRPLSSEDIQDRQRVRSTQGAHSINDPKEGDIETLLAPAVVEDNVQRRATFVVQANQNLKINRVTSQLATLTNWSVVSLFKVVGADTILVYRFKAKNPSGTYPYTQVELLNEAYQVVGYVPDENEQPLIIETTGVDSFLVEEETQSGYASTKSIVHMFITGPTVVQEYVLGQWRERKPVPDVSAFITKYVDDLVNYYTKQEVNNLISELKQFTIQVVDQLPQPPSADTMHIIYLVPSTNPTTQNSKDEFITVRSGSPGEYTYSWEQIGSTEIDLSNYVTITALNEALANYVTSEALTQALATKQDVIQDLSEIRSGASLGATAVQPEVLLDVPKYVVIGTLN